MTQPPDAPRRRRPWAIALAALKYALLAAVLWYVGREFVLRFQQVPWSEVRCDALWAAMSVLAMLGISVVQVAPFRILLSDVCPLPWPTAAGIVWLSSLGKYVPGKAASVGGAMYLLARHGVKAATALGTSAIVYGLMVVVGLIVAIPFTFWGPLRQRLPMAPLAAGVVLSAALVCLHPRVLGFLIRWLWRRLGRQASYTSPSARHYALSSCALLLNFVLYGTAIWLAARSLTDAPLWWIGPFITAGAAAAVAGCLALFAPGGIGVREGVLLLTLGVYIGPGQAAIVSLALRFVQTALEAVLGTISLALLKRAGRTVPTEQSYR